MKKIVFITIPHTGHTNPTITIGRDLVRRGHKVIFYSFKRYQEQIEKAGIEFRDYGVYEDLDPVFGRDLLIAFEQNFMATEKVVPMLLHDLKKDLPDCIVHDCIALWGKIVAQKLHVPAVSVYTSLAFSPQVIISYIPANLKLASHMLIDTKKTVQTAKKYYRLLNKFGIETDGIFDIVTNKEKLNLVLTSSFFQPLAKTFNNSFKFVGACIYERNEPAEFLRKIPEEKKIIYISMGTIFNDSLKFYQLCIETLKDTEYQIICSLGHRVQISDLPTIPKNFIIKAHIPQLEVLQRASVFISHAGLNSIHESFYFGVPMVLIPQMYEQNINAVRIQQLGAGKYLREEKLSKSTLLHALEKVLRNKKYEEKAKKIGSSLKKAGGYKKAADEIMAYVNSQETRH